MKVRFAACALVLAGALSARAAGSSTCNRDCLRGFVTSYLNALLVHTTRDLPLAENARFTEDTVAYRPGESPLWHNAFRLTNYRLDVLDVRQGVAASFAIVEESTAPVMLVLRLKIVDGKITEAETQVTRNQKEGSIFNPEALKSASAAMLWIPRDSDLVPREEAIRIAELYPAGLKAGSFLTVDVPFSEDAYRLENGKLMAGPGCTFLPGCDHIKTQKIPTLSGITARVVAVDEQLGIVLLPMDFGAGSTRVAGNSLVVFEAFKIFGGQIHAVEAFMKNFPLGAPSGWDSGNAK